MEHREVTTWVLASIFILFLLFSLYRPDLNLKDISGKVTDEGSLPSTNLVLRFDFEEGSGSTVYDLATDAGGTNNGQLFNNPTWITTGKYGNASSFDGTNDYIQISDNAALRGGQDWTISSWVKPESNGGIIFNKGLEYSIEITSAGKIKCYYMISPNTYSVISTNNVNLNSWNHIACSYNNQQKVLQVYLNNAKTTSSAFAAGSNSSLAHMVIGKNVIYFKGSIDSVRFYNSVLSDNDIGRIYNFAYCGNGIKEGAEECDSADKGTDTCGTKGFSGGTLSCSNACTFDTSQCTSFSPPTLSLANISNKIYVNSNLVGNISFSTNGIISNNSNIILNLSVAGYSLSNVISLQEYMNYLNKQGTQSGNEINYPAGTYSLEASKFNLVPNVVNNIYTLRMDLITPQNQKYSATKTLSAVYTENYLTVHNVTFNNVNGSITFLKGNFINCSAAVTDEKGLGIYSYKIWGPAKNVNNPDYLNSISCAGSGLKYCSILVNVTISGKGNWTCGIVAANTSNSFFVVSLKNITMINSAPFLKNNIPNKTWSGGNLNNAIDLKNYFEDPEGDSLTFNYTGIINPIIINIVNGIVNLNATNFSGSRNVYFSASDGSSSALSNMILLNASGNFIGNATVSAACISNWNIGNWSECMSDNKQFRIVLDLNNCNNETGKPFSEQSCVYQSDISTNLQTQQPLSQEQQGIKTSTVERGLTKEQKLLYSGILLGSFIILAIAIVLISKIAGKKPVVQINQKPIVEVKPAAVTSVIAKPVTVTPVTSIKKIEPVKVHVKEIIQPANLEAMRDYSVKMIMKGAETSKIKEALENAGWPKEGIEDAINYAVLYNFAKKKLQEGLSEEKIKSMLIEKKWDINFVNEIMNRL